MLNFNNIQHIPDVRPEFFKPGDMLYIVPDDLMDIVKEVRLEHSLIMVYTARGEVYAFAPFEYISKEYMLFRKLFPDN